MTTPDAALVASAPSPPRGRSQTASVDFCSKWLQLCLVGQAPRCDIDRGVTVPACSELLVAGQESAGHLVAGRFSILSLHFSSFLLPLFDPRQLVIFDIPLAESASLRFPPNANTFPSL
ncbi:hypothetical protein VTJ04DRAFT_2025 [Mycothermus thermophilus]|uniref:uncharacterized protein n=1 Tax=Humicola insolens TaxID=85995 RepID=UPI0037430D9F